MNYALLLASLPRLLPSAIFYAPRSRRLFRRAFRGAQRERKLIYIAVRRDGNLLSALSWGRSPDAASLRGEKPRKR